MPTYALLGATGATGSAILRSVLRSPPPNLRLNILVRSKSKLLSAFPGLESSHGLTIQIFEGDVSSLPAVQACLTGAEAIFTCIAVNTAKRGHRLFQDTARVTVDALLALRHEHQRNRDNAGQWRTPSVLALRAEPLNPVFAGEMPWLVRNLLWFALHHLYSDLREGSKFYEAQVKANPGLFEVVFMDPPGIHDPEGKTGPTGYELTVVKKAVEGVVSYADLGEAFVEVAGRRKEFAGKGVVVTATGKVYLTWEVTRAALLESIKWRVLGWFGIS